jgi:hypothetical protein
LVASKVVFAKIDRPGGTISFQPHKEPNEILNEWSHNINSLMQLLNKTNHLITKEEMVHGLTSWLCETTCTSTLCLKYCCRNWHILGHILTYWRCVVKWTFHRTLN